MPSEPSGDTGQLDAADLLRRVEACGVDVRLGRDRVRAVYGECRVYEGDAGLHLRTLTNAEALPIITVAAMEAVRKKYTERFRAANSPDGIGYDRMELDHAEVLILEMFSRDAPLALAAVEALEAVTKGGDDGDE